MKVFISWSGDKSKAIALALYKWLPNVIQSVKPFMSDASIASGSRWSEVIGSNLQETRFGIICVTQDNQSAPWLNFEAGALSKHLQESFVVPLAVDLKKSEIAQPLGQFNSDELDRDGMERLLESLNTQQDSPLPDGVLKTVFEKWWPDLEEAVTEAKQTPVSLSKPLRPDSDVLGEILDTVRGLARESRDAQEQKARSDRREREVIRRALGPRSVIDDGGDREPSYARAIDEIRAFNPSLWERLMSDPSEMHRAMMLSKKLSDSMPPSETTRRLIAILDDGDGRRRAAPTGEASSSGREPEPAADGKIDG